MDRVFAPGATLGLLALGWLMLEAARGAPYVVHGWLGIGRASATEETWALGAFLGLTCVGALYLARRFPLVEVEGVCPTFIRLSRAFDILLLGFALTVALLWLAGLAAMGWSRL